MEQRPENSAKVKVLKFLYKILDLRQPSYMLTLFSFASSARLWNLIIQIHRALGKSHSIITVVGSRTWNNLPYSVRLQQSLNRFKTLIIRRFN
jgi:hypothetical protein